MSDSTLGRRLLCQSGLAGSQCCLHYRRADTSLLSSVCLLKRQQLVTLPGRECGALTDFWVLFCAGVKRRQPEDETLQILFLQEILHHVLHISQWRDAFQSFPMLCTAGTSKLSLLTFQEALSRKVLPLLKSREHLSIMRW